MPETVTTQIAVYKHRGEWVNGVIITGPEEEATNATDAIKQAFSGKVYSVISQAGSNICLAYGFYNGSTSYVVFGAIEGLPDFIDHLDLYRFDADQIGTSADPRTWGKSDL